MPRTEQNIIGPDPKDIAEVNEGKSDWTSAVASIFSSKKFKYSAPAAAGGAALFGGAMLDAVDSGVNSAGIHVDVSSLASHTFETDIASADDPLSGLINPSPAPNSQPQPPAPTSTHAVPSATPKPSETPSPSKDLYIIKWQSCRIAGRISS